MSGIILDRSEFLALMDAVEGEGIIGINADEVVPANPAEHKALIEQGLTLLKARGAVREVDDVNIMDIDLLSMAMLVANPEVAVVTTRDNPGKGQQLFVHYIAADVVLEQTRPDESHFRWALVDGKANLVERLLGILPVEDPAHIQYRGSISQAAFLQAKALIESDDPEHGRQQLLTGGLPSAGLDDLVEAIAHPKFGGMVAVLQIRAGEATDARNLAVVQGTDAAYLLTQSESDPETLELTTTNEAQLKTLLANWLALLSAQPNH